MIAYTDECVDCGLPCLGSSCPLRNTPHYYCDICGQEIYEKDIAYRNDDYIICINCDYQEETI